VSSVAGCEMKNNHGDAEARREGKKAGKPESQKARKPESQKARKPESEGTSEIGRGEEIEKSLYSLCLRASVVKERNWI